MVVIDVSISILGRLEIHEDWTCEDVYLLPQTSDRELVVLKERMELRHSFYVTYKDTFLAALLDLYQLTEKDCIFYAVHEPELKLEL